MQKLTPHFDWTAYVEAGGAPGGRLNVEQPTFMTAVDGALDGVSDRGLEDLLDAGSC